ncbi:hypothetical protein [Pseudohongiella sp.]|uniref:Uncharacterized protein n=1 Tax=marine sediment metagenome TaxID=412755 RepID=A0A0F9YLG4_9ZZZZ|nr:hypothetical protein [Pseudohongiella sp.]HDZ10345.1 hypothetical protein [Pseudohongiella sp.]HEA62032.1 hypothetical protein [Pseudohongiella sp.]
MNNDIKQELSSQRFAQLLASYGADAACWPAAERAAALTFLDNNASARAKLDDARALDQWLQSSASQVPDFNGLEARLLRHKLPPVARSAGERLLAWLLPATSLELRQLWRPLAAACLPLAIGLLVGFRLELVPEVYATTVEEELYLISLSDYAEIL